MWWKVLSTRILVRLSWVEGACGPGRMWLIWERKATKMGATLPLCGGDVGLSGAVPQCQEGRNELEAQLAYGGTLGLQKPGTVSEKRN